MNQSTTMMDWYDIPGHVPYMITKKGEVWNKETGVFLTAHKTNTDYMLYCLATHSKSGLLRDNGYIHRLLALTFIKNDDPVNKIEVKHLNGNTLDNRIENLAWGYSSGNFVSNTKLRKTPPKCPHCFRLCTNRSMIHSHFDDCINNPDYVWH